MFSLNPYPRKDNAPKLGICVCVCVRASPCVCVRERETYACATFRKQGTGEPVRTLSFVDMCHSSIYLLIRADVCQLILSLPRTFSG